jgi:tripartite-type tricarboxylate transporter receptor subunit TctC
MNSALYKTVRYDPVRDFVAVHGLLSNTPVLICSPQRRLTSVAALVEQARQEPGQMTFASGGAGTAGHLLLELMQSTTGARFTHVPYKSGTAAQVDLIAGRIDCMFDYVASSGAQLRSGTLRALAVTGRRRLPTLPDVPTMGEAGFTAIESVSWGGLFVPAGTPAPIVKRLSDELDAVMKSDEVKALLESTSSTPLDLSHEAFREFVAREATKWGELIRKTGITLE